jgi:hypothetical protein
MARKNDKCSYHKNKKMSPEVYKLRREAMDFIYEANELVDLPRITIRITDIDKNFPAKKNVIGTGRMNQDIIWITERAITQKNCDLRTLVFHELLHAVYGVEHDESCPLMKATHSPLTKAQCNKLFLKHATK